MVKLRARVPIPLEDGIQSEFITFDGFDRNEEHFAIGFNLHLLAPNEPPWVRIHSECITGDLFGSQRCDCGNQLIEARRHFEKNGGYLLYLRQEGRGIGLKHKLDAYLLQEAGLDTFEANARLNLPKDGRNFACAAEMLHAMKIKEVNVLTNNPRKVRELASHGIRISTVQTTGQYLNSHNERYLRAKQEKDGHRLGFTSPEEQLYSEIS